MEHPDRNQGQGGREGDVGTDPRRTREQDDDRNNEKPGRNPPGQNPNQRPNQTPKTG